MITAPPNTVQATMLTRDPATGKPADAAEHLPVIAAELEDALLNLNALAESEDENWVALATAGPSEIRAEIRMRSQRAASKLPEAIEMVNSLFAISGTVQLELIAVTPA